MFGLFNNDEKKLNKLKSTIKECAEKLTATDSLVYDGTIEEQMSMVIPTMLKFSEAIVEAYSVNQNLELFTGVYKPIFYFSYRKYVLETEHWMKEGMRIPMIGPEDGGFDLFGKDNDLLKAPLTMISRNGIAKTMNDMISNSFPAIEKELGISMEP